MIEKGCNDNEQYIKIYSKVSLPFQIVERIPLGSPRVEPNKLIFGDNLHIMKILPSNSIDLIYIDPPFFSGKNYKVVFGDSNETRSFTDIWKGGLSSYLTWLNARLLEMKRLLKPTGSIYVHVDWHASHYVKIKLDKIFGYENFRNEICWKYKRWTAVSKSYQKMHDTIFWYTKSQDYHFETQYEDYQDTTLKYHKWEIDEKGKKYYVKKGRNIKPYRVYMNEKGVKLSDVWNIPQVGPIAKERVGYPTQKPEILLKRIINTSCPRGGLVADFFCGSGTTAAVAQKLGRRWITSDISKIAVSVTRDRLLRDILGEDGKTVQQSLEKVPDIEVSHLSQNKNHNQQTGVTKTEVASSESNLDVAPRPADIEFKDGTNHHECSKCGFCVECDCKCKEELK